MPINKYSEDSLTWHPDKTRLARPIYKSLVKLLKEDISSGKLPKDTKLPSQRELADFLDLNFTTVGQAYRYAIKKGLLYTNIGRGTYTSPNAYEASTISTNDIGEEIIDFGLVSSFDQCNSLIIPFIQSVAKKTDLIDLLNYRNPKGTPEQLKTAARWLDTQGVIASTQNIAIVSGVQNGLAIVLAALFSPGDRIAVDRFTYSNFIELAHLYHLEIVPIDYDDQGMCTDKLELECLKKKIHGIFLMPSCNNPMGFQVTFERRIQLSKIIKKEGLIVIEDDSFSFLTTYFQKDIIPPFQQLIPEQTIYLAGVTKYIGSGLRVAFLSYPPKLAKSLEKAIFNINVKTSGLDAEIVNQVLQSSTAQRLLEEKFKFTKRANEIFDEVFKEINPTRPSNYYPLFRTLPLKKNLIKDKQNKIEGYLLKRGIRVYHSKRFSTQTQPDSFIRISLSSNSLEDLKRGLEIIEKERIVHIS